MRGMLSGLVLLSGCAPPVEETAAAVSVVAIAFFIPLVAAAVFSTLAAWGLVAAKQARQLQWARPGAVRAGVGCLIGGGIYAALALGNTMLIVEARRLPEAEPLLWLTWPGPTTAPGSVLLGVSGAVMLAVGAWCLLAKAPEEP